MDNSVYITLSRQLALFRDMEATANNVANMNTTGYNAEHMMFASYLVDDGKKENMAFAHDISTYHDVSQGTMQITNNPLDLAIGGDGYFMFDTPLGTRYGRAGNFQLASDGTLVSSEGYPVLDAQGQQIQFAEEDRNIVVGGAGNISVDGEERSFIGVVRFDNPQLLEKRGAHMYYAPPEATSLVVEDPKIAQGALEQSNVQPVIEMTHMIEVSRAVGSTAKFIETVYDLQRRNTSAWTQPN